jgi:plastocyanin
MRGKVGVAALACVVVGVVAMPTAAAARTKVVYAGGQGGFAHTLQVKYGGGVNNFVLNKVTINAGDTVAWDAKSLAGGFHSVDIPKAGGSDQPLIVPTGTLVSGVKDFAGNPFWFNGKVPNLTFNPALFAATGGHTYNGSARIDSGLPLGPPKGNFKVKFTKPGVYHYFCDVHYGMQGTVIVLAKGKHIPSAKQDAKALKKVEKAYVTSAKHVDRTTAPANSVSVGASGPGGLEVFAMFPATLHVKTGAVVTFFMSTKTRETHTATFGDTSPNGYVGKLAQTAFNSPTGAIDPIGAYPSDVPMPIVSLTSHGNGFANTGALDRDASTPPSASGQIKFTQPGTYHYLCLIHSFMHGTVVVTN